MAKKVTVQLTAAQLVALIEVTAEAYGRCEYPQGFNNILKRALDALADSIKDKG